MSAAARIEAAGGHVIHMEVGQPFASAPRTAIEAARRALGSRIGYTEALGIPSLRERIARHYNETHRLDLDPERVIVTTGSSAGFILAFLAMFEAGERVGIANPGYPPYRHILTALGCEPVLIETNERTRWAVTPETLRAVHREDAARRRADRVPGQSDRHHDDARGACGADPRGGRSGIKFISDEIYHGLDYAFPAETALRISDRALVINSFSKYFCMTGWRVGWIVAPEAMVRPIERLAAESRDLGAASVAGRGGSGVRWPRRDGRGQARL